MPPQERPTTIALGNALDFWIDDARVRGIKSDVLAFRGFVAATRLGGPIHADLTVPLDALGAGSADYVGQVPGANVTAHLTSYLHTTVFLVCESVPPGQYRDAFAVRVVEDQSA